MGIWDSVVAIFRKRKAAEPMSVQLEEAGLTVSRGDEILFGVNWSDVREVVAFKRDQFVVDSICVGFRVDETDQYFEVSEDFANFEALLEALPRAFPGIQPDWYGSVMLPVFETNWMTIWGK